MTDIYFGIKLILAAIVVGFLILLIPIILIATWIDNIREKRIVKYFESIGCERYLIDVGGCCGTNCTYGWRRKEPFLLVRDSELRGMKLKEIKREYK